MASQSLTTTDHDEIRRWAESRQGRPCVVRNGEGGRGPGILRIDFPGGVGDDRLEEIPWEEFFQVFDRHLLAFLYQEKTADGRQSRFSRLIARDSLAEPAKNNAARKPTTSQSAAAAKKAAPRKVVASKEAPKSSKAAPDSRPAPR